MELRQLQYFFVVAQELSFTRAAKKLGVSQPPLSYQIANLEAELGCKLFHRTTRSVELSEAGNALLPHVRAVLDRLEQARAHLAQVAQGFEGSVKIGLSGSHFLGPLPHFIAKFRAARPKVDIALHEMMPADHLQALREGAVDISLSRGFSREPALDARLLWADEVIAVLPVAHRLAGRKRIRLKELREEALVMLRADSSLYARRIFDALVAEGFIPRVVQYVIEIPAMVNLVAAGLGVALVPASLARVRKGDVVLCQLSDARLSGDVYALTRAGEAQPAVVEFLRALVLWAQHHA
jgi:LysR family transcriptional regulator, benzoate and cis,cis-muconate-responsive activator of ben and cat genes